MQFRLTGPEPMLHHGEPILREGGIVGQVTSGAFGHHLGTSMGMGYVYCPGTTTAELLAPTFEIGIA